MHHTARVRRGERRENAARDRRQLRGGERSSAFETGLERLAFEELHDEDRSASHGLDDLVDEDDARMPDRREHRCLAAQAANMVGRARVQQLERARCTGREVPGRPDDARASFAELALQDEPLADQLTRRCQVVLLRPSPRIDAGGTGGSRRHARTRDVVGRGARGPHELREHTPTLAAAIEVAFDLGELRAPTRDEGEHRVLVEAGF